MSRLLLLACLPLSACGLPAPTEAPALAAAAPSPPPEALAKEVVGEAAPPAFEAWVSSLRVRQSTTVRSLPSERSAPLGVLAQDMRVRWRGAEPGPGCERWIELEPRGFVCERVLEPSRLAPVAVELPRLDPGAILPGIYGVPTGRHRQFRSLSVLLKFRDEVKVRGRTYLRTRLGKLFDARKVRVKEPSTFSGIALKSAGAPLLPLAWGLSRSSPQGAIAVWSDPSDGELLGLLEPRAAVPILGQTEDGLWARVAEDAWISFDDLHVARLVEPPPGVGPAERWVDVDLTEQVLVAYEGRRPVFTTLVSTGTAHPTPEGSYRIWIKFSEADMRGNAGDHRYSVSSVPWTMYFHKDFALHAAYWHDGFGEPRSNGCVNLSPLDARKLYLWTSPEVPTGWSMSYPTPDAPGSLVRIRRTVSHFNDAAVKPANRVAARPRTTTTVVAKSH